MAFIERLKEIGIALGVEQVMRNFLPSVGAAIKTRHEKKKQYYHLMLNYINSAEVGDARIAINKRLADAAANKAEHPREEDRISDFLVDAYAAFEDPVLGDEKTRKGERKRWFQHIGTAAADDTLWETMLQIAESSKLLTGWLYLKKFGREIKKLFPDPTTKAWKTTTVFINDLPASRTSAQNWMRAQTARMDAATPAPKTRSRARLKRRALGIVGWLVPILITAGIIIITLRVL